MHIYIYVYILGDVCNFSIAAGVKVSHRADYFPEFRNVLEVMLARPISFQEFSRTQPETYVP